MRAVALAYIVEWMDGLTIFKCKSCLLWSVRSTQRQRGYYITASCVTMRLWAPSPQTAPGFRNSAAYHRGCVTVIGWTAALKVIPVVNGSASLWQQVRLRNHEVTDARGDAAHSERRDTADPQEKHELAVRPRRPAQQQAAQSQNRRKCHHFLPL